MTARGGSENRSGSESSGKKNLSGKLRGGGDTTAKAHDGSGSSENFISNIQPTNRPPASSAYAGTTLVARAHDGSGTETTVQQRDGTTGATGTPQVNTPVGTDGGETTNTETPRGDSSVVLAGQVGAKKDRSPARSNNFVSLVGGAGGLGRKTSTAKRTLIGGA